MIYKKLGFSNIKVSTIGMGTNGVGNFQVNDRKKILNRQKIYRLASENGINLFDSAELYGDGFAENVLGKTFKENRKQIIISSKVTPNNSTYYALKKSFRKSLKRLQTDYIDLYQLHWINPSIDLEETFLALEELVSDGLLKAIGVCNFTPLMINEASKYLRKTKIVSNQIEFNLLNQTEVLRDLDFYNKNRITVVGYGSLNYLGLEFNREQQSFLDSLQKRYDKTLPQILIAYFTSFENVVILFRTDSIDHLKINLNSFGFKFSPGEVSQFYKLFKSTVKKVTTGDIRIPDQYKKLTIADILKNQNDWIPSPLILAQTFIKYNYFKPIKLLQKNDYYDLDRYDFYGELKKYLAWKILYQNTKPIPAIVKK